MNSPETPASRQRALEIARHVFHLLTTVVPSAKQQAFAAHNPADFALVSFGDLPISLANAFEAPIKPTKREDGFLKPSIQALADYWATIHAFHCLNETAVAASAQPFEHPAGLPVVATLPAVEQWIVGGGAMPVEA